MQSEHGTYLKHSNLIVGLNFLNFPRFYDLVFFCFDPLEPHPEFGQLFSNFFVVVFDSLFDGFSQFDERTPQVRADIFVTLDEHLE